MEAKTNTVLGMDVTLQDLKKEGYKATYLAVGCQKGAKLAIPGEETDGVIQGVDFLRQAALGKPADGIKKAVVIGGGNVAIDAARTLGRLGSDVTILYRRSRDEMPAFEEEVTAAIDEGAKIQFLAGAGRSDGQRKSDRPQVHQNGTRPCRPIGPPETHSHRRVGVRRGG